MAGNVCAAPFSSERLDRNCVISSGSKHFRRVIHCRDFIEDGQSLVPSTLLANFFEINLLANTRRLRHLPHCGHATLKIETIRKRDSGLTVRSRTLHRLRSGREKHEELSKKQQASLAVRSKHRRGSVWISHHHCAATVEAPMLTLTLFIAK